MSRSLRVSEAPGRDSAQAVLATMIPGPGGKSAANLKKLRRLASDLPVNRGPRPPVTGNEPLAGARRGVDRGPVPLPA